MKRKPRGSRNLQKMAEWLILWQIEDREKALYQAFPDYVDRLTHEEVLELAEIVDGRAPDYHGSQRRVVRDLAKFLRFSDLGERS
jgi:hypothetical protein